MELIVSQTEIWEKNKSLFGEPFPVRTAEEKRDKSRFCAYHRGFGHTTDECWSLKAQIEGLIKKGNFMEFMKKKNGKAIMQKKQSDDAQGVLSA